MKTLEIDKDIDITENPLFKASADHFFGFDHIHRFCDLVSRCHKFAEGHLFYVGYLLTFNELYYEILKMYINHDGIDFKTIKEHHDDESLLRFVDDLSLIYADDKVELSDQLALNSCFPITSTMEIRELYLKTKRGDCQ